MNYVKIYNNLITKYKNIKFDGYFEIHHIIPLCIGGTDSNDNLVKLPARVHFIVHLLLAKIYGGKLIHAAWMMSNFNKYNNRTYCWLREAHRKEAKKYKHTEEAKKKMGTNKGKSPSLATRIKNSLANKGKPKLEHVKIAIAIANSKRIWSSESRAKHSQSQKLRFARERQEKDADTKAD